MSFEVSPGSTGRTVAECDARRVGMARRVAAARLRYCGLGDLVDDATLIVSELVTNAILHSGGHQVTLSMAVRDGWLRISVHDQMPGGPTVRTADGDAERGRGLFLVESIADARGGGWGTDDDGATTWCALALEGETA
ncbi:ATP-binding protein [Streptomyces chiangmaiensis]|uniref:ATP-binding protein n=1 Tax=Streptomyces chiangmaiensis TaxID=766497 RepID=A0ABU7FLI1_9ACTN|nr:ATP-binding protein [Streptomyces chiangmaiensis]MED7824985.1 ATP-binding protein [Streptomyces chiangmaiensis]